MGVIQRRCATQTPAETPCTQLTSGLSLTPRTLLSATLLPPPPPKPASCWSPGHSCPSKRQRARKKSVSSATRAFEPRSRDSTTKQAPCLARRASLLPWLLPSAYLDRAVAVATAPRAHRAAATSPMPLTPLNGQTHQEPRPQTRPPAPLRPPARRLSPAVLSGAPSVHPES